MCCHYWRSRCYLTPAQRMILLSSSSSAKPSCVPIQPIASHSRMMVLFVVAVAATVVVLFCFFSIVKSGWNFRGGKCRTQQKFCIWIVGSFVRSLIRSLSRAFTHTYSSSIAMTLGRVQCEKIVWWCDEVISIDFLYFLKIYALWMRFLSSSRFSSFLRKLRFEFIFFSFSSCFRWIVTGKLLEATKLAIFRYVYAVYAVLVNLCDELF